MDDEHFDGLIWMVVPPRCQFELSDSLCSFISMQPFRGKENVTGGVGSLGKHNEVESRICRADRPAVIF